MNIFKLVGTVYVDTDKANESLQKTDESSLKTAKSFQEMQKKVGESVSKVGKIVGGMAIAAGTALVAVTNETREYRAEMGKLDAAFTSSGMSSETAKNAYAELYSVIGETDQSVEAAQQIALLASSEKDVATWADLAAGVVGKFGDALQPETFFESANETIKLGEATGAYVQMLEGCGMNVEKFNAGLAKCSSEQEKQAFMLQYTEACLGSAGEAYRLNNADIIASNAVHERLNSTLAQIGEAAEPLITTVMSIGTGFLETVTPAISDFCTVVSDNFPQIIEWFGENKTKVGALAVSVGILATAYGVYNTVQTVKNTLNAMEAASLGVLIKKKIADAAATAAAMAPYVLIVAAITAVIAVGVLLYKNWDKIKEKAVSLWQKLKSTFDNIKTSVTSKIDSLKDAALSKFELIKNGIVDKITAAKDLVKGIIDKIKGFFNFTAAIPKIKLPHFAITPEGWKLGDLLEGIKPELGIEWYAKAMDNPMVMTSPTIFGYNSATGQMMGGGETGSEVVSGTNTLMGMISDAVASQNGALIVVMKNILAAILSMDGNMGDNMKKALDGTALEVNRREFARLVREVG